MKLDAHPLIVAVALGMLGPGALVDDDGDDTELFSAGEDDKVATWEPGPAPSPEEFHRVELEWLKQA
jgi:hypothetical protein